MVNSPDDAGPNFEDLYLDYDIIDDPKDNLNSREINRLLNLKDGIIVVFKGQNYRIGINFGYHKKAYLSVYDFEKSGHDFPVISCTYQFDSKKFLNLGSLPNPKPDHALLKEFLNSYVYAPLYLYMIDRFGMRD